MKLSVKICIRDYFDELKYTCLQVSVQYESKCKLPILRFHRSCHDRCSGWPASIVIVVGGLTAVDMIRERHEQKLEQQEIEKEKELEKEKQRTALLEDEEL